MRNKTWLKILAFLVATATLLLGATACGRDYHVTWEVVVVPRESPRAGKITEVSGKAMPLEGTPLAGARVRITLYLDRHGNPTQDPSLWLSTITNAQG